MSVDAIRDGALRSQRYLNVRNLAEGICEGVRSKDYLSECLAILNFVRSHTRYMKDPRTVELVRAPYIVVEDMQEGKLPGIDCDDMASLIAALCLSAGHQVRIVTVAFQNIFYRGMRQYTHVFAQAYEPRTKKWITLDPVPAYGTTNKMLKRVVAAQVYPVA